MELHTQLLLVMAASLALAAGLAWRLGNERRDIGLLGGLGGLASVAAVTSAVL